MIINKKIRYFSPETIEEAASLLEEYGDKAKLLAGGTDLLVMIKDKISIPKYLINLKKISGCSEIQYNKSGLIIGALNNISAIKSSDCVKKNCFSLHEAAESFGTTQVRNMATIGGNICRSSPSADMVLPLLAHDASVKLVGVEGEREVLLENFFTGPGQNVLDKEIVTEIKIIPQKEPYGDAFEKIARSSEDLAKINCAVKITMNGRRCDNIGIALGAVAAKPVRAKKAEKNIKGKEVDDGVIEKTAKKIREDIAPITDVRSNAWYRKEVSEILVKRLINRAISRVGGTANE